MTIKEQLIRLGFSDTKLYDDISSHFDFHMGMDYGNEYKLEAWRINGEHKFTIRAWNKATELSYLVESDTSSINLLTLNGVDQLKIYIQKLINEHRRHIYWYVQRYYDKSDVYQYDSDNCTIEYCKRYASEELATKAGKGGFESLQEFRVFPIQVFNIEELCSYPGPRHKKDGDGSAEELADILSMYIPYEIPDLTVVLDFDGLPGFAGSWLDELIGRLSTRYPRTAFRMRGKELSKSDYLGFYKSIDEWKLKGIHPNSKFKL